MVSLVCLVCQAHQILSATVRAWAYLCIFFCISGPFTMFVAFLLCILVDHTCRGSWAEPGHRETPAIPFLPRLCIQLAFMAIVYVLQYAR